ncbi:MAG: uroporphyrinogen decarboxylase family protein, partial [bacterium]
RVKSAIAHEETDIVPYDIGFTQPAWEKLVSYLGRAPTMDELGLHIAHLGATPLDAWVEVKPGFWRDEFGVIWNRTIDKDIGNPEPILLEPRLKGYEFPDPDDPKRYAHFPSFIEANKDKFILCEIGFSLFERAWSMRGMENLLVDMKENPSFVHELLEAIAWFNVRVIRNAVRYPIDGFYFGDDWGQQRGLIMGPLLWREFLKPRLKMMYEEVHKANLPVFIHSCGDVKELFPELIEIGVNVFNPFQPEVMDIYEMKRRYGNDLTFYGGISVQRLLPFGTPEEVKRETKRILKELGKGGGYIASPSHAIPKDVPLENILALIETLRQA